MFWDSLGSSQGILNFHTISTLHLHAQPVIAMDTLALFRKIRPKKSTTTLARNAAQVGRDHSVTSVKRLMYVFRTSLMEAQTLLRAAQAPRWPP
jgi:hypothetical protein